MIIYKSAVNPTSPSFFFVRKLSLYYFRNLFSYLKLLTSTVTGCNTANGRDAITLEPHVIGWVDASNIITQRPVIVMVDILTTHIKR
jgi:hypothetical protein